MLGGWGVLLHGGCPAAHGRWHARPWRAPRPAGGAHLRLAQADHVCQPRLEHRFHVRLRQGRQRNRRSSVGVGTRCTHCSRWHQHPAAQRPRPPTCSTTGQRLQSLSSSAGVSPRSLRSQASARRRLSGASTACLKSATWRTMSADTCGHAGGGWAHAHMHERTGAGRRRGAAAVAGRQGAVVAASSLAAAAERHVQRASARPAARLVRLQASLRVQHGSSDAPGLCRLG